MLSNILLLLSAISWPNWDRMLFFWINGHHTAFLDQVMVFASGKLEWIPLYIFLCYQLFRKFRYKAFLLLLLSALCLTLTDQLSVHLFKDVFQRFRPCHEPAIADFVRIWEGRCGGSFGFVSSHAANAFGIAVFLSLLFQARWVTIGLLVWASLVSYSRVYLGVHYPLDVIMGCILGMGIGTAVYKVAVWQFLKVDTSTA